MKMVGHPTHSLTAERQRDMKNRKSRQRQRYPGVKTEQEIQNQHRAQPAPAAQQQVIQKVEHMAMSVYVKLACDAFLKCEGPVNVADVLNRTIEIVNGFSEPFYQFKLTPQYDNPAPKQKAPKAFKDTTPEEALKDLAVEAQELNIGSHDCI